MPYRASTKCLFIESKSSVCGACHLVDTLEPAGEANGF
jgi:hypothetical protein